jgi:hypothetical protein
MMVCYQVVAGVDEDGDDDDGRLRHVRRVRRRRQLQPLHREGQVPGHDDRLLGAEKFATTNLNFLYLSPGTWLFLLYFMEFNVHTSIVHT